MHATSVVSVAEARRFLRSLIEVEGSSAELSRVEDQLILQLYRETLGRRGLGRIVHRFEHTFASTSCVVAHNGLNPQHAVILLHGFASSPLHIFPIVERYHNIQSATAADEEEDAPMAWVLPRGPIAVSSVDADCVYTKATPVQGGLGLLTDSNLYCWWELNSALKSRGTFRQLVKMIKNKLFSPINVQQVVRDLADLIEAVSQTYGLPYPRICLAGFCQGATLASEYLLFWNQHVSAERQRSTPCQQSSLAVCPALGTHSGVQPNDSPLGGGILLSGGPCRAAHESASKYARHRPSLLSSSASTTPQSGASSCDTDGPADRVVIPLFIAHGFKDTVVPYALGRLLKRRMLTRGFGNIEFCPFKGGHEIPDEVLDKLHSWFLTHKTSKSSQSDSRLQRILHPVRHHRAAQSGPVQQPPPPHVTTPRRSRQHPSTLVFNWQHLPGREAQFFAQLWLTLPRLRHCLVIPASTINVEETDENTLMRQITGYDKLEPYMRDDFFGFKEDAPEVTTGRLRFTRKLFSRHGTRRGSEHLAPQDDDDEASSSLEGNDAKMKYWLT